MGKRKRVGFEWKRRVERDENERGRHGKQRGESDRVKEEEDDSSCVVDIFSFFVLLGFEPHVWY